MMFFFLVFNNKENNAVIWSCDEGSLLEQLFPVGFFFSFSVGYLGGYT